MEYTLELCSRYTKKEIQGKPVIIFEKHNEALPVWGTYASQIGRPMNLITFDTHTDTHAPFVRYLFSEKGLRKVPYDKSVLDLPEIKELLDGMHFRRDDFCFEDVFRISDMIACDEHILTAAVFDYLASYRIVHKQFTNCNDTVYGYDSEYITHENFIYGSRPEVQKPLILDIDLDYFGEQKEILRWAVRAEAYIKQADVITIAREPKFVIDCRTDEAFTAEIAEQEIIKSIDAILSEGNAAAQEICENEKAFAFYVYTLSIISTGLSPEDATIRARKSFDPTSVVSSIQENLGKEESYSEMLSSTNPVPYYDPLMELLITDPNQDSTAARNIRVRYVLTKAVIENRIEPEEILLHDKLFKEGSRAELDELWKKADPNMNLTNRLKKMYLERQKTKQAKK